MLSQRFFITITDTTNSLVASFDVRARGLVLEWNEHGDQAVSFDVTCGLYEAFELFGDLLGKRCDVHVAGHLIWSGRVEDAHPTSTGISVQALGPQMALRDLTFTQFWSSTHTEDWEPVYTSQISNRYPDRYRLGNQDGLFLALQRGDTYGSVNHVGSLMYRIPDQSGRNIYTFSFNWEITLPTNWQFVVETRTAAYGSSASTSIANGNGATQTGTSSLTLTANAVVIVSIYNNTGANYTATGETGSQYARLTGVRLKGTTSSALYADEIVRALVDNVATTNGLQLANNWALIQSPGLDLRDELYEDASHADILDYLCSLGDTAAPPRMWEWGVTKDRALYFRPRGTGRTWYIDAADIDLEGTIGNLVNSVYATRRDESGRTVRTATSADAISVNRFGFTRRAVVDTQTTVDAQATTHRDAALTDGKDPRPRSGFEVRRIYSDVEMQEPPWRAQPGDTIVVRNIDPAISANIDRIRTFVLSAVKYDASTGIATLTPEDPLPSLDVITARYSAGMPYTNVTALNVERNRRQPPTVYINRGGLR